MENGTRYSTYTGTEAGGVPYHVPPPPPAPGVNGHAYPHAATMPVPLVEPEPVAPPPEPIEPPTEPETVVEAAPVPALEPEPLAPPPEPVEPPTQVEAPPEPVEPPTLVEAPPEPVEPPTEPETVVEAAPVPALEPEPLAPPPEPPTLVEALAEPEPLAPPPEPPTELRPLAEAPPEPATELEPPERTPEPQAEQHEPPAFILRGRLRRRARYLRALREVQLRDVGGFVLELHRYGRARPDLVEAKLEHAATTDTELRAIERALGEPTSIRELREPGIGGACNRCGAVHGSVDRFCAWCGEPLSAHARSLRRRDDISDPLS